MTTPPEERRPPLTPQLAMRVAIVGSLALGMFAIIFFRLWFLQVLSGDQYVHAATVNRVRDIPIAAPRGDILARDGTTVLVDNRKALAVQISPQDLPVPVSLAQIDELEHPPGADQLVYNRLSRVLGLSNRSAPCELHMKAPNVFMLSPVACAVGQQLTLEPYNDVTIRSPRTVNPDLQVYLAERQDDFPGVQVARVYVTHYPHGTLAAQVLGTVGPISPAELGQRAYRGIPHDSIIGQSGLESQYDEFLLGTEGQQRVQVNSLGQPAGDLGSIAPVQGHDLRVSLDAKLQKAGEAALAQSISDNSSPGGAFVALSPTDGQVYAMGSWPSYNPSLFTGNLSKSAYEQLTAQSGGQPLLNRAIQSAGPTGSTFKPITATAALQSGLWSTSSIFDDTGSFCTGAGASEQCRHNAGHAVDGSLDLVNALRVSSDDFFYNLGARTNADPALHPHGGPLQQWARAYGIGQPTGIDLPGEAAGTLPDPVWRQNRNRLEAECDAATGPFAYTDGQKRTSSRPQRGFHRSPKHAPGGCGIADGTDRGWSVGDNESLAVGQGDVQVTPLQLAVAYSALANGGTIVRPHFGLDIQDNDGTVRQTLTPPPARHIDINPFYRQTILQGLHDAAQTAGGTSDDVMGDFPQVVYGKTGTAQYTNQPDYAWYACFVNAGPRPIVVVVTVEQGGFGDVAAAPVARQILSQWFYGTPGRFKAGTSSTL